MSAITLIKATAAGKGRYRYSGVLLASDSEQVVVDCIWDRLPAVDVGALAFEPNDRIIEYYYRHRWINIFELRRPDDSFKGWYCNIAINEFGEGVILWRDLSLDLVVLPDGTQQVLDEAEFEQLALDDETRARCLSELQYLQKWAAARRTPFDAR
ncbi:MAG: DUF402 domain-containing protein [Chloroflexi bacterium]|nr:DUF402 domain-containing protein [Chloroflexota bacterium]